MSTIIHDRRLPYLNSEEVSNNPQEQKVCNAIRKIFFHAIAGTEYPQTIRILVKLKNKDVMVLIDCGSTHNFIDQTIVFKFGLPVIGDKKFQVMVANREKIDCIGQCQALTLTVQGHSVAADYYVLPVAACQLVFKVQWLETLSPIKIDYNKLTMTFKVRGVAYTFRGLNRTGIDALTDKELNEIQSTNCFFQIMPASSSIQPKQYPHEMTLTPG